MNRPYSIRYCQHHRTHVLNLEEVDHPLFANPRCDRKLSLDARRTLINALVSSSTAEWLDGAGRTRCLVLWRSVASWGEALHDWACELGHQGGVVTVDEIGDAREGPGGDFVSVDEEVIVRAAKYLEALGKAALLPGEGGDDTGVKFL
jgi:ESCRT-II complex subunit VPS25